MTWSMSGATQTTPCVRPHSAPSPTASNATAIPGQQVVDGDRGAAVEADDPRILLTGWFIPAPTALPGSASAVDSLLNRRVIGDGAPVIPQRRR